MDWNTPKPGPFTRTGPLGSSNNQTNSVPFNLFLIIFADFTCGIKKKLYAHSSCVARARKRIKTQTIFFIHDLVVVRALHP